MKLLVLAAGYATRLRPLTDNQAKPLLPVAGRPMLEHVLEKFADCPAIDAIYIVTNHRFAPNFQSWAEAHGGAFAGRPVQVIDDGTLSNDDRLGAIGDIHFVIHKVA
ncbi:MAG TPA: NTP transferase domain-containing protein, partial [Pseudomonadota bacterium]|nr:NTP transferase domain-containing protein [Pseudomonadota bacterium]